MPELDILVQKMHFCGIDSLGSGSKCDIDQHFLRSNFPLTLGDER